VGPFIHEICAEFHAVNGHFLVRLHLTHRRDNRTHIMTVFNSCPLVYPSGKRLPSMVDCTVSFLPRNGSEFEGFGFSSHSCHPCFADQSHTMLVSDVLLAFSLNFVDEWNTEIGFDSDFFPSPHIITLRKYPVHSKLQSLDSLLTTNSTLELLSRHYCDKDKSLLPLLIGREHLLEGFFTNNRVGNNHIIHECGKQH
jgi:hypothetical protein